MVILESMYDTLAREYFTIAIYNDSSVGVVTEQYNSLSVYM